MRDEPLRLATSIAEVRERLGRTQTPAALAHASAFRPRPSDVLIATYPKSGTTWMQQIAHGLRTGGSMDFADITLVVPWIEMAHDAGLDLDDEQVAAPRVFKTHLPFRIAPKGGRVVHLVRDPKDVLLSYYHFLAGWILDVAAISLERFARDWFLAPAPDDYWNHLRDWWVRADRSRTRFFSYEDLKEDLPGAVARVARFMGVSATPALLDVATRQASFDFMRAHVDRFDDHVLHAARDHAIGAPPGGRTLKVRAGLVGGHRGLLGAPLEAELDAVWAQRLGPLGFPDYAALRRAIRDEAARNA